MTRYLTFAALLFLLNSCILKQIDYPYAENNTTEQYFFGTTIKDDYKWLEINLPTNEKRTEWLDAQYNLSENNVNRNRNKEIYNRITELGNINYTLNAGIIGDDIYYLKINLYRKQASLHKYSRFEDKRVLVNKFDFPFHLRSASKVRVSPDGQKIAIIVENNNGKFDLYIYDTIEQNSRQLTSLSFVKDYHVRWTSDSKHLFFIKDGINDASDDINSLYVSKISLSGNTGNIIKYITPEIGDVFNSIEYVYDDIKNDLYITTRIIKTNQINLYRVNPDKPSSMHLWHTHNIRRESIIRIAGIDSSNMYFFEFDKQLKGALFALKRENKKVETIMAKREDSFSGFSMIKDHILIGYKSKEDQKHEAYIINCKTYEKKPVGVSKKGRYRFLNNPNDSMIYFNHESHSEPRALYSSSVNNPDIHTRLCHFDNLPYNTSDFITEYPVIKSNNGKEISLTISYKKGFKKNGRSPAILMAYLNGNDELRNSFYFSRILYMEQGFIFVQRNDIEHASAGIPLRQRAEDIKSICDYLITNNYTAREKLCLSGRQYGCTAIAQILNEKPDFCKTSIMIDGVFDLVNYNYAGNMMYSIGSKSEFESTLNASPYHHVKNKACYPSIMLLTTESNPMIEPWQTHKYVARLQMRTKGCNPILLYQPEKRWISDSYEITDYFDSIYQSISFLSNEMDVDLSPANYSKPESQSI